ncbi:uncharacterized protein LOC106086131 [Stomoxys calcitrans]|uniref:uncharacterized protein LOC106086131 n=1 Tax=Stomoxys calcitrans TaxID=35570 RepID=UPI0027E2BD02|nr:uncharacterized protein LOC106086131 [Stomoxys calcitrans]
MFTPIKNLITYIQKNANFGSNTPAATEGIVKMETADNLELQSDNHSKVAVSNDERVLSNTQDVSKEKPKHAIPQSESELTQATTSTKSVSSPSSSQITEPETLPQKDASMLGNSDSEDDDIESQIESSIMLKKPVKDVSSRGKEILELRKSPERSVVISHDFNRDKAIATPTDDELEDFRHDPTEVVTSSPLNNGSHFDKSAKDCSVDSAQEAKENSCDEGNTEYNSSINNNEKEEKAEEEDKDKTQDISFDTSGSGSDKINESSDKIVTVDSENEDEAEEMAETMSSVSAEDEDTGETYLDLDTFPDSEVVVISYNTPENNTMLNTDSIDTANTSDDPLAIACEDQEAFAADKISALQELNLLNTSGQSQDEDTTTTTTTAADDDLLWLRNEPAQRSEQPSCSNTNPTKTPSQDSETPEKEERNGEGSDSGLGSETSALHTTNTSLVDTSHHNMTSSAITPAQSPLTDGQSHTNAGKEKEMLPSPRKPLRSNLKRRLEVDDDDVVDTLRNITSSLSSSSMSSSLSGGSVHKKPKRSINFDNVQVYYFPRQQGFSCVPSAGGCTLGMGARHVGFKTLTLAEHAAELRRAHRMQLQEINPRGSSSDDSEESEEDYLSEGSGSDLDGESNGFLQPVSPKQRRTILKAAGIRKIDPSEKVECRDIRNSREVCGCSCRDFCDPETCSCSQSGIKCQVDRDMFPCGCSRDACGNTIGRVEFNPARVRTHFIHTLMRLEMENRQQQNPYSPATVMPTVTATATSYYQSHLQPQSNYSSGYASPAYNSSSEMHQLSSGSTFYHQQAPSNTSGLYGQPSSIDMGGGASTSSAAASTSYGMDSLDTSLFSSGSAVGGTVASSSYGELIPVPTYHHHNMSYGNVQTQVPSYNSYHNSGSSTSSYINPISTSLNSTPNNYSSCAVPSIPPFGAATTTEASGGYHHSVNTLTTVETTTAPSCTKAGPPTTMDTDVGTSFISLSTPLASSSRLSQINDLLQHNRNANTALVAVSQNISSSSSACSTSTTTTTTIPATNISGNDTLYNISSPYSTAPAASNSEAAHKTCSVYANLTEPPPLTPAPTVISATLNEAGPTKLPAPPPLQPASTSTTSVCLPSELPLTASSASTLRPAEPMIDLAITLPSTSVNSDVLPQLEIQEQEEPRVEQMDTDEGVVNTINAVLPAAGKTSMVKETTEALEETPTMTKTSTPTVAETPTTLAPNETLVDEKSTVKDDDMSTEEGKEEEEQTPTVEEISADTDKISTDKDETAAATDKTATTAEEAPALEEAAVIEKSAAVEEAASAAEETPTAEAPPTVVDEIPSSTSSVVVAGSDVSAIEVTVAVGN